MHNERPDSGMALFSEVFHHPHVAICGPAVECQMAPIWRRMSECFTRTSGVLPKNLGIALKIHMQDFSSVPDASW